MSSKTNNKPYVPKQESKRVIYLDANDLYGYVISKCLPTNGFKWIDPKEFDLNKYTGNSAKGCVLEIELHNDYILVPDKVEIKGDMLSEYKLNIADLCNVPLAMLKN